MWVTRGKIGAIRRMLKCFPAKSFKFISHQIGSMGTVVICKRMIPPDSIPRRFDFMARRSSLSYQETNHTSLLFFACLHFQCWKNTLYTTLTSRAIKKQLCGPVSFQYACLLPYRWQYRYVTTVLSAFARNVFYGGVFGFRLTSPHVSSTRVRYRTGSLDEMRWSPFIEGLWIARIPDDQAWRRIPGANEMNEMSVEKWWNKICGRGKREKSREKPTQTPLEWPRGELGSQAGGGENLTAWVTEPPSWVEINKNKFLGSTKLSHFQQPIIGQRFNWILCHAMQHYKFFYSAFRMFEWFI